MNRTQIVAENPHLVIRPLERLTKVILDNGTCMFEVATLRCDALNVTLSALPTSQVFVRPDGQRQFECHVMDAIKWLRELENVGIR